MKMRSLLQDERLALTALEPTDLEFLYKWENDTTLWCYSDTLVPLSRNLLENFIKNAGNDIFTSRQIRLMIRIKTDGAVAGMIDLYDIDFLHGRAAVGILIADDMRHRHYGYDALILTAQYASSRLGLHQLYAYIPNGNEVSGKLFMKAGYKNSGVLKEWHKIDGKYRDLQVYQLIMD